MLLSAAVLIVLSITCPKLLFVVVIVAVVLCNANGKRPKLQRDGAFQKHF